MEQLGNLVMRIQATGADIVKVQTTALDIIDNARLFQVLVHSQVLMIRNVMGENGLKSRIIDAKLGEFLTFGSLEAVVVSTHRQSTVKEMLDLYNMMHIGPDTRLHRLIGNPISHSKNPHIYNILQDTVILLTRRLDFNVILSYEERLRALDGTTPASGFPLVGKTFVVIGAGGAGKALAYGGWS
ncbi:hypothetical protein CRYUN_Cryun13aG0071900 [Craigia yunnanensis]